MTEKYIRALIEKSNKEYLLERYRTPDFRESHVPFIGTPRKHPHDPNILILVENPFSNDDKLFYEFTVDSIGFIEELEAVTDEAGNSAMRVRVWIKKGKTAIKSTPFIVS